MNLRTWMSTALLLCGLLGGSLPVHAQETNTVGLTDLTEFRRLLVLYNGRVMPMQTFARLSLQQFSGRTAFHEESAESWMARLLFDPTSTIDDRMFLINHPGVAQALNVTVQENRRYSFNDLHAGVGRLRDLAEKAHRMEEADRSQVENELMRVYNNLSVYLDLFHAFEFARPHPDFVLENEEIATLLGLRAGVMYSFMDVFSHAAPLKPLVEPLATKNQDEWTSLEKSAFWVSNQLFTWSRRYTESAPDLIPVVSHGEETWLSAWASLTLGFSDRTLQEAVRTIAELQAAYTAGQLVDFNMSARSLRRMVTDRLGDVRAVSHGDWEIRFNGWRLFFRAKLFYALAFFIAIFSLMSRARWPYRTAMTLLILAFVLHTAGMLLRMMIMGRPPMTNLYATFIFVSWVCVVLALIAELIQRNSIGILTSSLSGLLLLLFAERYIQQGDTMGAVVAVLDSNFWLSTHVTTIAAGYAGCLLAGAIAHVYLIQTILMPHRTERLRSVYYTMVGVLGFGLTFAFLGTMLGGVWADQSWGRFWGWDPKENGALLIVLWSSILYHARAGRMIGDLFMAAGCILGMIVVMLAWLGVNLLGVGLHSYGFTSGLALNLFVYSAVEIVFVAIALPWAQKRLSTVPPPLPAPVK